MAIQLEYKGGVLMYERMLNKNEEPTIEEMNAYCKETSELFTQINTWLSSTYHTEQKITFPYGNSYGWGIAHRLKNKLICNVFPEKQAFTVMMRLSNEQYKKVEGVVSDYTMEYIDHYYSCGDGGWIHYRITELSHLEDCKKLLTAKLSMK